MIGYVRGKILAKNLESHSCVVLAHRIGYEVTVSKRLYDAIDMQSTLSFWIHSHVREDAFILFGFASEPEKQLFRTLLTASGLGPKTALSLLSEHGAERLFQLILDKDADTLCEAPGVGKKLAQKIILELGTKMEKLAWMRELPRHTDAKPSAAAPERQLRDDLASALANLGFAPQHVKSTLDRMFERGTDAKQGFADVLKLALKEMSGRVTTPSSSPESTTHG